MAATLFTLGSCVLRCAGQQFVVRPAIGTLLAYLSLEHPAGISRADLAAALWPGVDSARARRSLSQLLYEVRTELPPDLIFTTVSDVTVNHLETDVTQLRRLIQENRPFDAYPLYDGGFIGCIKARGELADWAERIEERVVADTLDAIFTVVTAGPPLAVDVLQVLSAVLRQHPFHPRATRQLIEVLVMLGRTKDAKDAYERFTSEIDESLPPFEVLQRYAVPTAVGHSGETWIPFVGRKHELDELNTCWDEVEQRAGRTILMYGEPGIGKTRLADHFLRRIALAGAHVWTVHCSPATQRLPYSVIAEIIRQNIGDKDDDFAIFLQGSGAWAFPVESVKEWKHQLVQYLTEQVLTQSTDRPLAIFIDDVQWTDEFTAFLIKYWSYRLRDSQVMLILTLRTDDGSTTSDWNVSELVGARALKIGPLSTTEAGSLLQMYERTKGVDFTESRRESSLWQSAGRPFLLLEVLDSLRRGVEYDHGEVLISRHAETVLGHRLTNLSEDAEWVLGLLSVIGRPIAAGELIRISGNSPQQTAAAITELHKRGILQSQGGGHVAFVHALMRQAAKRHIAGATWSLLHARVALAYSTEGADSAVLAEHYAEAGDAAKAGQHALAAGATALAGHMYTDAEHYLRLAMTKGSEQCRPRAAIQLTRLLLQLGRVSDAALLTKYYPPAGESQEGDVLRLIVRIEQDLLEATTTATKLIDQASRILASADLIASADLTRVIGTLFDLAVDAGELEFGEALTSVLKDCVTSQTATEVQLQINAKAAVWLGATKDNALGLVRMSELVVPPDCSTALIAVLRVAKATLELLAGALAEAELGFSEVLAYSIASGDSRKEIVARLNLGVVQMERGEMQKAKVNFEIGITAPNIQLRLRAYSNLAIMHYESGEYSLARQAADAVIQANKVYAATAFDQIAYAIQGLIGAHEGDWKTVDNYAVLVARARSDNGFDDTSYALMLLALHLANRGENVNSAMDLLDAGISAIERRHRLATLRMQLCKAQIMQGQLSDQAYAIAKAVQRQANSIGARTIADKANETVLHCNLYREV